MKYKVGDRVLIKKWYDMEKEYKIDRVGDILIGSGWYFLKSMKHLCEKVIEIEHISDLNFNCAYRIGSGKDTYYITDDMIERKVNNMTKEDLKDGMVCKTRDGKIYVVFGDNVINIDSRRYLGDYYHDLTACCFSNDIVEVYTTRGVTFKDMLNVKDYGHLRWKREEAKELTVAEIEKLLGYPVKIVKE